MLMARLGPPIGDHFARARDALEIRLHGVRDALQFKRTAAGAPVIQRRREDRHIVDALGFDDRLTDSQARRAASRDWN